MSNTGTNLLSGLVENKDESQPGVIVIKLSGEPYANALTDVVAANYNRVTGRPKPSPEELYDFIGQKITLIRGGQNMLGGGILNAMEGKLFEGTRGMGILPKGARKKGYSIPYENVIDVIPGYDTAQAQELVASVRDYYPTLQNLTQERLEELPKEGQGDDLLRLALLGEWRMPDSRAVDCVWMIGEYWPEDDICDRSVLLIRPEHGTSESGSCYGRQLIGSRFLGEIVGFEPISFKEAVDLCFIDFDEACKVVFDRATVAA